VGIRERLAGLGRGVVVRDERGVDAARQDGVGADAALGRDMGLRRVPLPVSISSRRSSATTGR